MTDQPDPDPNLVTLNLLPPEEGSDATTLTVKAGSRELVRITVHQDAITATWTDRMPDLVANLVRDALRTG